MFTTLKSKTLLRKYLLPIIEYSFSTNSYVCLIWIFIFETDRAQIYSVQKKGGSSRNRYTVKKRFLIFLSPAGMSCTKLSLGGNNDVIYKLFPPWECLVSDIPAADGNVEKLFLRCSIFSIYFNLLKNKEKSTKVYIARFQLFSSLDIWLE